jgi:hypothetical protein
MQPMERFLDIPVVKINPEFQSLIPLMVKEEKDALEASLLADGCRDPLVVWDGFLIDGHMRWEIIQKHGQDASPIIIPYQIIEKTFESKNAAKLWIINNQFARRNLTPKQISYLRGIRHRLEKGEKVALGEPTAKKLAKEYGVSPRTIERDAEFAAKVDTLPPEEKAEILTGKVKKTKGEITGKKSSTTTPLDQLKKWWKKANESERTEFIAWAGEA